MNDHKVSVIVPVYNGEKYIKKLLNSLMSLNYPEDSYEIIVVDNNSIDNTMEIIKKYPVKLLEEKEIQSSYAARNKGIQQSKYDILAFTDADCIVDKNWLKEGIKPIVNGDADLVGGKVEFYFSKKKTIAELYDSITHMQIENNVNERNVAKTANLITKKKIFKEIGLFPDNVQSGGDVQWTGKATINGFRLVYGSKIVVLHPARTLGEMIKKQYRVGKGMPLIWKNSKGMANQRPFIIQIIRLVLPRRISTLRKQIIKDKANAEIMMKRLFKIWLFSYFCKLSSFFGVISYYISRKNNGNKAN